MDEYAIACMEVWGGNRLTETKVTLPGISAWVYSQPLVASAGGGDVHYLSVCNAGLLSRVALADVSGHGPDVNEVAERLRGQMHEHINTWDQSELMRNLGDTFRASDSGGKYATAVFLGYYRKEEQLAYTLAGHPEPLRYRARDTRWELLKEREASAPLGPAGLPLGMISGTTYHQSVEGFGPGDLLVLYTDALVEVETQEGEDLGRERLLELARGCPTDSPVAAGRYLLEKVRAFNPAHEADDDETLIVLQRTPE